MTKLKFFLTEKEFLNNYMGIKELQNEWLINLLSGKFTSVDNFLKAKINHKYVKNIHSEDFYVSADYQTSAKELEKLILNFEKTEKKLELLSKAEILTVYNDK